MEYRILKNGTAVGHLAITDDKNGNHNGFVNLMNGKKLDRMEFRLYGSVNEVKAAFLSQYKGAGYDLEEPGAWV